MEVTDMDSFNKWLERLQMEFGKLCSEQKNKYVVFVILVKFQTSKQSCIFYVWRLGLQKAIFCVRDIKLTCNDASVKSAFQNIRLYHRIFGGRTVISSVNKTSLFIEKRFHIAIAHRVGTSYTRVFGCRHTHNFLQGQFNLQFSVLPICFWKFPLPHIEVV